MIVRGTDLGTGRVVEIRIEVPVPVQARLSLDDLRYVYPRRQNKPNSLSTIKRWVREGLIPVQRFGKQVFVHPDRLPDAVDGVLRVGYD